MRGACPQAPVSRDRATSSTVSPQRSPGTTGGAKMARVKDREPPPPPYAPPAAGPPEHHGAFGEAPSPYERTAGEASLRARTDAASAGARGALGTTLLALCVAAFFAAAATLLYGVIAFPDAPIREVATSYY